MIDPKELSQAILDYVNKDEAQRHEEELMKKAPDPNPIKDLDILKSAKLETLNIPLEGKVFAGDAQPFTGEFDKRYFTPEIEDIHVGYECEIKRGAEWKLYTVSSLGLLQDLLSEVVIGDVRTPYLTKEQLEAEGWKVKLADMGDMLIWGSELRATKKLNDNITYHLNTERNNQILIQRIITNIEGDKIPMTLFSGECKDINTFRYICKLLNIK